MKNKNSFNIFDYLCRYFENEIHGVAMKGDFLESNYTYITYEVDSSMKLTSSFKFIMKYLIHEILQEILEENTELYEHLNSSDFNLSIDYFNFENGGETVHCMVRYYYYYENDIELKVDINLIYRDYSNSFYYKKSNKTDKIYFHDEILESKSFADILIHQAKMLKKHEK